MGKLTLYVKISIIKYHEILMKVNFLHIVFLAPNKEKAKKHTKTYHTSK